MPKKIEPPKVKLIQPEQPVAAEIIATAIVEIAAGMKKLNESRLTRRAIVTLISQNSKIGHETINIILNNLDELEVTWLKPVRR